MNAATGEAKIAAIAQVVNEHGTFAPKVIGLDRYVATTNRFSTFVTPGAAHAARSASSRSANERTVPVSTTAPSRASTLMR
jgi:hypothetical protein